MIFFADTSALVKRYISETGSEYIRSLLATADNFFYQSFITSLEIASALYHRHRMNELSREELAVALQTYAVHSHTEYLLIPYSDTLLNRAGTLLAHHLLRSLDAIQLAAALTLQKTFPPDASPFTFLSADDRLLAIARLENLLTDNPNTHQ